MATTIDEKTARLRTLRLAKEAAEKSVRQRNATIRRDHNERVVIATLEHLKNVLRNGSIEQIDATMASAVRVVARAGR